MMLRADASLKSIETDALDYAKVQLRYRHGH